MTTTEKEMLTKLAIVMIDVDGAIGATLNPDALIVTMLDGTQFKLTIEVI